MDDSSPAFMTEQPPKYVISFSFVYGPVIKYLLGWAVGKIKPSQQIWWPNLKTKKSFVAHRSCMKIVHDPPLSHGL